ncbi:ead/Ea22-like family protein [Citrobacter portucalensis]|uniref:ead/Ea22-like family protein n=1 Tax=Citrobacter portucalensis TaxID=1639133 RepID=UPI001F452F7B|nr:ead/Ea22-like family protein [Citrobacter portucalensis]MCC2945913.1 ead/Ea22-like family protein [Citrobacter freundii]MCE9894405.1 ead/Ea22-like family protein [Citrobacter portucalensis]UKK90346.1 ead/Ea22-like family protein [Citrobacter portucalensis]
MTIDKQALRKELSNPGIGSNHHLRKLALSLLDELEIKEEQRTNWFQMAQKLGEDLDVAEKRIAELEAEKETLRPVGVMSEKAFHRLENRESRFIALWPRPGIYLPRKRPDDGVIVYARTAADIGAKGE